MRINLLLSLLLVILLASDYMVRNSVPLSNTAHVPNVEGPPLALPASKPVVAVRFSGPGGCIITNQSNGWTVEGFPQLIVNPDTVIKLLVTMEAARVIRTFDSDALDIAQYGLTAPSLVIGLRRQGETEFQDLYIGTKNPAGSTVYAKWAQQSPVFTVGAYFEKQLLTQLQALQHSQLHGCLGR